jgi:hypothetical protein
MTKIIRPDQFPRLFITEDIIALEENPTWNHFLGLAPNEIDFAHVVYVYESTKYPPIEIITYKLSNAPFGSDYLIKADTFAELIEKYRRKMPNKFNFQGLLFLATTYVHLRGEINFLEIMHKYVVPEGEDDISKLFSSTYGKLIYHFQLEKLYKIVKDEKSIRSCKAFRQNYNLKRFKDIEQDMLLVLPSGKTLREIIDEHKISESVYKPNWTAAGKLFDLLRLLGKVDD